MLNVIERVTARNEMERIENEIQRPSSIPRDSVNGENIVAAKFTSLHSRGETDLFQTSAGGPQPPCFNLTQCTTKRLTSVLVPCRRTPDMPPSPDPEQDGRSSKRQRSSLTNSDMAQLNHADPVAEDVLDIVPDGDVLLDLGGLAGVQKE